MLLASNFDKSRFWKAQDLTAEKKLRIKSVTEESVGDGKEKEQKLVVWFTNDPRGLVLNKTNNRTLRGKFGDDCDGWKGNIIVLFPTMAEFRGDMKPALRVRIPSPKDGNGAKAAPPPPVSPPPRDGLEEVLPDVDDDDLNDEIVL